MLSIYNKEFAEDVVASKLQVILGQVFRLLPLREEGGEWQKPLETLIEEVAGLAELFPQDESFLTICAKLQGLLALDCDFLLYRRVIFDCCNLISKAKEKYRELGGAKCL